MKLAQARVQQPVFDPGEDSVPNRPAARHRACDSAFANRHSRAEHRVRFTTTERRQQRRQRLRGKFPITTQKSDKIKTVLHGVAKAELLVSAAALVYRIEQDANREGKVCCPADAV